MKHGRVSYQDWSMERRVFCSECGLEFENIKDYQNQVNTIYNSEFKDPWVEQGCPRCRKIGSFITNFDIKFAFDDEHNSFVFKGDGIASLREDSKDRGGILDDWSWYGNAEWTKELILVSRAYELLSEGYKPVLKQYKCNIPAVIYADDEEEFLLIEPTVLCWEDIESIEEFVAGHTVER